MEKKAWFVLAVGAVLVSCGERTPPRGPAAGAATALPVATYTVRQAPWVNARSATGTVQANESAVLTAKVTETVKRVNFQDGERVDAGTVLVELTDRAELAALEEAQAAASEAVNQHRRLQTLRLEGTVSAAALDTQRATMEAARARVQAIRSRLGDRIITAPFAGQLGFRQVSPGALVTPGTPIATLDDIAQVKLEFALPEADWQDVRVGQTVQARSVAYPDRTFAAQVTALDSRVDPGTRAFLVRARVDNADGALRPGMLLSVRVESAPRPVLQVPELSVFALRDRQYVYRIDPQGQAQRTEVRLGARQGGMVEVRSGLQEGDQVVTDGLVRLREGARVRVTGT